MIKKFLLLLIFSSAYFCNGQRLDSILISNTGHDWPGHYLGVEFTSLGEKFPSIQLQYTYFFSTKMFTTLRAGYVTENEPKISGFDATVQFNRIITKILYAGIGYRYAESTLDTRLIVDRLNGAFFESIPVSQTNTMRGLLANFGLIVPLGSGAFLDIGFTYNFYDRSYTGLENITGNIPFQKLDNRLKVTPVPIVNPITKISLDFALLFKF